MERFELLRREGPMMGTYTGRSGTGDIRKDAVSDGVV